MFLSLFSLKESCTSHVTDLPFYTAKLTPARCVLSVQMPEAEWNDERTRIVCELFAEQVQAGNRPNTHLNNLGYRNVAAEFQQRTQLLYTKLQLKNKWDKFKSDYITWKKLLVVGAGLPWDAARGTFAADDEWWKKTNKVCDTDSRSVIFTV